MDHLFFVIIKQNNWVKKCKQSKNKENIITIPPDAKEMLGISKTYTALPESKSDNFNHKLVMVNWTLVPAWSKLGDVPKKIEVG